MSVRGLGPVDEALARHGFRLIPYDDQAHLQFSEDWDDYGSYPICFGPVAPHKIPSLPDGLAHYGWRLPAGQARCPDHHPQDQAEDMP